MNVEDPRLKDNTTLIRIDSLTRYEMYDATEEEKHEAVRSLADAIESFGSIAAGRTNDIQKHLTHARRRLTGIFDIPYQETTDMNHVKDLLYETLELSGDGAHTIQIQKGQDYMALNHANDFILDKNLIQLDHSRQQIEAENQIYSGAQGVREEHAPHKPYMMNRWRYSNGKISFAFKKTNDEIVVGLDSRFNKSITDILKNALLSPRHKATFTNS